MCYSLWYNAPMMLPAERQATKLYAHFRETQCHVQPTTSGKLQWRAKKVFKLLPALFNAHFTSPKR